MYTSNTVLDIRLPLSKPIDVILASKPTTSTKTVRTILTSNNTVDGVTTNVYKNFVRIVHTYNNKGVVSNQTITNTFSYSV